MDLQTTWFILLFVLLIGYAILDGFDLGVGMLHLTGKTDNERRVGLQAIGPIWDGNEVWLITGGGALFAAFPFVYATVFSAMYLALFLVLIALIGRACAIEFRSKEQSPLWRQFWDVIFFLGSALPALLFGVAFGNILHGLPITSVDNHLRFTGDFLTLLNPFSLGCGLLSVLLFLTHGAIYLAIKSDGPQQERMRRLIPAFWMLSVIVYVALWITALLTLPHLMDGLFGEALIDVLIVLVVISSICVPVFGYARKFGAAIIASGAMIGTMMAAAAAMLYPRIVPSSTGIVHSLTITQHSSSPRTLQTMLIIALTGVPVMLLYTICIYRVFKGKTIVNPEHY